jgi:putative ABC transport system permease protein
MDRLVTRLKAIPGVEGAAVAISVPLDIHGIPLRRFVLEGRAEDASRPDRALSNIVTPGYFAVMDIAITSGTDFAALNDPGPPPQAIVNEEFVHRYLDGAEPLGRRITVRTTAYTIVGVVKNSLYDSFGESPKPAIYYSYRDVPYANGQMHIRTSGSETALAPQVERAVRELDASLPVYDVRTMTEHVDKNLFLRKIPARMFVALGPLLLLLAAIGIYAVVDYAVQVRTHEIGLRLALGASHKRIVRQLIGETLRPVIAGALAGLFLALLIAMHAAKGVISLPIFLGVPALLIGVASLACWVPARRAAGTDPMVALRRE